MPDESAAPSPKDVTKSSEQIVEKRGDLAVSSALQGHVDYVDLTERVALGVTVKMPDAAVKATPGTQLLFATDGEAAAEAPQESTPDTTAADAKK